MSICTREYNADVAVGECDECAHEISFHPTRVARILNGGSAGCWACAVIDGLDRYHPVVVTAPSMEIAPGLAWYWTCEDDEETGIGYDALVRHVQGHLPDPETGFRARIRTLLFDGEHEGSMEQSA